MEVLGEVLLSIKNEVVIEGRWRQRRVEQMWGGMIAQLHTDRNHPVGREAVMM